MPKLYELRQHSIFKVESAYRAKGVRLSPDEVYKIRYARREHRQFVEVYNLRKVRNQGNGIVSMQTMKVPIADTKAIEVFRV